MDHLIKNHSATFTGARVRHLHLSCATYHSASTFSRPLNACNNSLPVATHVLRIKCRKRRESPLQLASFSDEECIQQDEREFRREIWMTASSNDMKHQRSFWPDHFVQVLVLPSIVTQWVYLTFKFPHLVSKCGT